MTSKITTCSEQCSEQCHKQMLGAMHGRTDGRTYGETTSPLDTELAFSYACGHVRKPDFDSSGGGLICGD